MSEIIAIACDHAGYLLKQALKAELLTLGYTPKDLGTHSQESADYPDYASKLCHMLQEHQASRGVLICGSGIGMSIAANRFAGIRAALCRSGLEAELARKHNDANVLCLGARVVGPGLARDILLAWLGATFEGGRHARRVAAIDRAGAS